MELEKKPDVEKHLLNTISQLLKWIMILISMILGLLIYIVLFTKSIDINLNKDIPEVDKSITTTSTLATKQDDFWHAPDINEVTDIPLKEQITYGRDLIANTQSFFGTQGSVKKNAINGLNCQNCHLEAGTKVFGNNYSAVASTYPKYRARSGTSENIYKRVNDCFERSLNGEALDTTSKEMQAITAYIKFLGKDVPKGEKPKGAGFKDLKFLDRAADPSKGNLVFTQKCQSCHQANGEGQLNIEKTAYTYPPLWGSKSYNDGAGLFRVSNFAKYVKYNMPQGVSHDNTQLTDEESWDVAAFVNSQPRPKKDVRKDWPKLEEKPFDNPVGPYVDGFDERQHKYGPFKPIKEKLDALKKAKEKTNSKIIVSAIKK